MKKMIIPAALCAFLLTNAVPAIAHHAFPSEFDATQPVILGGTFIAEANVVEAEGHSLSWEATVAEAPGRTAWLPLFSSHF